MEAELLGTLRKQGWSIEAEALVEIFSQGIGNIEGISKILLDTDFHTISSGSLPDEIFKSKNFTLRGVHIVQLVSVKNVSQPKFNSARKGLLLLEVTDGKRVLRCLDYKGSNLITMETPPGTKLKLMGGTARQGILLIEPGSVEVLGGNVESLVAEWKLTKRTGVPRAKPHEEIAPPFEHFNPHTASRRLDLGGFSTFAILAQSTEAREVAESSGSRDVVQPTTTSQIFQNRDAVRSRLDANFSDLYPSKRPVHNKQPRKHVKNQSTKSTLTLEEFEAQQHPQRLEEYEEDFAEEFEEQLQIDDSEKAAKDLMTSMFSYTPSSQPQSAPIRGRRSGRRGRGRGRGRRGRR